MGVRVRRHLHRGGAPRDEPQVCGVALGSPGPGPGQCGSQGSLAQLDAEKPSKRWVTVAESDSPSPAAPPASEIGASGADWSQVDRRALIDRLESAEQTIVQLRQQIHDLKTRQVVDHPINVVADEDALEAARGFGKSTGGETLFFDVFIQDLGGAAASSNAWPERLYPVPVYVREAPDNDNAFVNDDFFVRRFFVIDETVGVKTAGDAPLAVTYARTVELTTAMSSSDNKRIAVPKFSVSYASRDPSFEYVATDAVSFRATYTSSADDYWNAFLGITCAVFCVAAVYWRYSIVKVSRRRQVLEPDATWAGHAVGGGASAIAFGSFAVLFWASGYFFTLYKAQTEVYVMVPLDGTSVVKEFEVFLDVAVAFAARAVLDHHREIRDVQQLHSGGLQRVCELCVPFRARHSGRRVRLLVFDRRVRARAQKRHGQLGRTE